MKTIPIKLKEALLDTPSDLQGETEISIIVRDKGNRDIWNRKHVFPAPPSEVIINY